MCKVATVVLDGLLGASRAPGSGFEVAGVVSQPARPRGRNPKHSSPVPSPVTSFALDQGGFPASAILTPERPGDPDFIVRLEALEPDLFVTAAYGNYLPSRVLRLPRHGTLNIHPSLLPLYRGAAPVQRALLVGFERDGATTMGVSVLYSVKRMDAGPILAQAPLEVASDIQAPELTRTLFSLGTRLLIASMPAVLAGHGPSQAAAQDETRATEAPKLGPADAPLDFLRRSAAEIHAQVRACAGWPGSTATLVVQDAAGGPGRELTIKVLETRVSEGRPAMDDGHLSTKNASPTRIDVSSRDTLAVRCGDGSRLLITRLQVPGKRPTLAADFINGLRGQTLTWVPLAKDT